MDTDTKMTGPTSQELVAGGLNVELEVVDHDRGEITYVSSLIRLVPVAEYDKLRAALLDESKLIHLYLGKGYPDQVPQLTPAAHEYVIREGRRINAHFFEHWLPRRRELESQLQAPQMTEFLALAAREFAGQLVPPPAVVTSGSSSAAVPPVGTSRSTPSAA